MNFAAETHVDRSILGPAEFIQTDVAGTQVLLDWCRATDTRLVQVSTDEVYGDLEAGGASVEDDPLRPSSPYSASKAGGDLQVLAYVRTYGVDAVDHARRQHLRAEPVPGEAVPLMVTNALDGAAAAGLRRRAPAARVALRRGPLRGDRARPARADARARSTTSAATSARTSSSSRRILELTGADPALVRHVEDRPGHDRRYALDTVEAARPRLGAAAGARRRPRAHGRLVPRQPRLVGADQVGRVPRVLRAAVRRAPRRLTSRPARLGPTRGVTEPSRLPHAHRRYRTWQGSDPGRVRSGHPGVTTPSRMCDVHGRSGRVRSLRPGHVGSGHVLETACSGAQAHFSAALRSRVISLRSPWICSERSKYGIASAQRPSPSERLADVVVGVRLVELAAPLERGERLLRHRQRLLVAALAEQCGRLVGEGDAVGALLRRRLAPPRPGSSP